MEQKPKELHGIFLSLISLIKVIKIDLSEYLFFKNSLTILLRQNIGENDIKELMFLCHIFPNLDYLKMNFYKLFLHLKEVIYMFI